jgi:integrase
MANELILAGKGELEQAQASGANPAHSYLVSLTATGRRTMTSTLGQVAAMLGGDLDSTPWAALRYEHVTALRTALGERGLAPATVNKYLAAVRGVMREAWRLGQIDAETYQRIAAVKGVTGSTLPAGRGLGPGEIGALMRTCANDHTPAGARDAAIIAMGYGAGLRRAELAGLDLADLADDGDIITATIRGKGNKERLVYLDNGSAQAVRDWLAVRGGAAGALFYSGRRGGHLVSGQRMSGQAIRNVLAKRADDAGLDNATPHDLRRSFVSDLLEAGVDISTVASMAGHANIETTRRYDRRGEQAKRKAARALHVPYQKRGLQD